jgi:hypothetical protein
VDSGDVRNQVEILNVDRLAFQIAQRVRGAKPVAIYDKELADLWAAKAADAGLEFAPTFLVREWANPGPCSDAECNQPEKTL